MINRRQLLNLIPLPFLGKLFPKKESDPRICWATNVVKINEPIGSPLVGVNLNYPTEIYSIVCKTVDNISIGDSIYETQDGKYVSNKPSINDKAIGLAYTRADKDKFVCVWLFEKYVNPILTTDIINKL